MRIASLALVAVAGLSLLGCNSSTPATPTAVAAAPPAAPPASAPTEFRATGPLVVENQLDLLAQRDGVVVALFAEPGTRVKAGQLLARLDDRQLSAERDAAAAKIESISYDEKNWEARVKIDEVDLSRAEQMWEAQLITKEQLDHQRFKLVASRNELEREKKDREQAMATLRALDMEVEKTRIMAPFAGIVARRYVRAGQKVANGDRLFWVTATAPLQVRFTLPERFIGKVRAGDELPLSSEASPGKHAAKVRLVSPVVDPSSGTIEVVAQVVGAPAELLPGMTVSVTVPE